MSQTLRSLSQDSEAWRRYLWLGGLALALAALATLVTGLPLLSRFGALERRDVLMFLVAHAGVAALPIFGILVTYERHRDFLHPLFVASVTYLAFHVLLNPLVASDEVALRERFMHQIVPREFAALLLEATFVVGVAWCAFALGAWVVRRYSLEPVASALERVPAGPDIPHHIIFLGVMWVLIGVLGNVKLVGSVSAYIDKIVHFYARPIEFEFGEPPGATKWKILTGFLPFGLLAASVGLCYWKRLAPGLAILVFGVAGTANMLLWNWNGGRGNELFVWFYSVVLYNVMYRRLRVGAIAVVATAVVLSGTVMGYFRDAAGFAREATVGEAVSDTDTWRHNASFYISNFVGTLTLVEEVRQEGTAGGATALAGFKNMFGGPAPMTTQREMWLRMVGRELDQNPKYGPPGELYFSWGYPGVVLGMLLIGGMIGLLGALYEEAQAYRSVGFALLCAFCAINAQFIVGANLNYLPPQYVLYSLPCYLTVIALGRPAAVPET